MKDMQTEQLLCWSEFAQILVILRKIFWVPKILDKYTQILVNLPKFLPNLPKFLFKFAQILTQICSNIYQNLPKFFSKNKLLEDAVASPAPTALIRILNKHTIAILIARLKWLRLRRAEINQKSASMYVYEWRTAVKNSNYPSCNYQKCLAINRPTLAA